MISLRTLLVAIFAFSLYLSSGCGTIVGNGSPFPGNEDKDEDESKSEATSPNYPDQADPAQSYDYPNGSPRSLISILFNSCHSPLFGTYEDGATYKVRTQDGNSTLVIKSSSELQADDEPFSFDSEYHLSYDTHGTEVYYSIDESSAAITIEYSTTNIVTFSCNELTETSNLEEGFSEYQTILEPEGQGPITLKWNVPHNDSNEPEGLFSKLTIYDQSEEEVIRLKQTGS